MAQVTGKVIAHLEKVEGENEKGTWVRGGVLIRTLDDRSRMLAVKAFGTERVEQLESLKQGEVVVLEYRPESREFNGQWYTDLYCTNVLRTKFA